MSKNKETLDDVANSARVLEDAREQLMSEAAQWVAKKLGPFQQALERAVMVAKYDDHTISDIARAYTVSGKTPNRNAVYKIIMSHSGEDGDMGDMPFEWRARQIKTARGERTVYDITANLKDFGPDKISGEFRWRFDEPTQTVDPVLDEHDPYPVSETFYRKVLERWVSNNPYPREE
jgi:hypothetical protein